MSAVLYHPGEPCPCGCLATASKLSSKTGHVAGTCQCASCRGRRNRAKGLRAQRQGHRSLGGTGFTPSNEESASGYPIRVQVEWKTGDTIPANLVTFLGLDWTRHALSQASRARKIGDGAMPAIGVVLGERTWLVVECDRDMDGVA